MRGLPFLDISLFRIPAKAVTEPSGLIAALLLGDVQRLDESPPAGLTLLPPNLRMIPRCWAYRPDGRICGEPANNLDLRRGFPTCDAHIEAKEVSS